MKFRLPIFNLTVSEANPIYLKASYERNSFIKSSIITNDLRKAISLIKIFNMTNILFWLKICLHIMPGLLFSENVANSFAQEETVEDKVWEKHFESFLEIFVLPHAIFLYQQVLFVIHRFTACSAIKNKNLTMRPW